MYILYYIIVRAVRYLFVLAPLCVKLASFSYVCIAALLFPRLLLTVQRNDPQSNGLFPLRSFRATCRDSSEFEYRLHMGGPLTSLFRVLYIYSFAAPLNSYLKSAGPSEWPSAFYGLLHLALFDVFHPLPSTEMPAPRRFAACAG